MGKDGSFGAVGKKYGRHFYALEKGASSSSAGVIVPKLIRLLQPGSVVDFGCGAGAFLREFQSRGVRDCLGVDGPWVDPKILTVHEDDFIAADISAPLDLGRKFGLALCLEVAEHIDGSKAGCLVRNLCRHSDIVVFSAAIPFQGGTHHVNEQWPDYWARLFRKQGYAAIDCLRPMLWNEGVSFYYAQNTLLFVNKRKTAIARKFRALPANPESMPLALVHPKLLIIANTSPMYFLHQHIRKPIESLLRALGIQV